MDAFYFYAAVFGFLGGVFLRSLLIIPDGVLLFTCLLALVGGGAAAAVRRRWYGCVSLLLLMSVLGAVRVSVAPASVPPAFDQLLNQHVDLEGTIITPPDLRESNNRLMVEIKKDTTRTRIIASAPTYPTFHVGDRVRVSGTLKKPKPFDGDGGRVFRYDQFLAKDGVFAIISPAHAEILGRDTNVWLGFLRVLEDAKDTFVQAIDVAIPEPESALAVGIIAGGKQGLGERLLNAFTVAGMLQIVVLSGYNVMIVAECILAALRFVPKRTALGIAAIAISLFVLAAGAGTAALRAGIMALIALLARSTDRTYDVLRALFAALVLMLLWNPYLLVFDPGLQLSFMATLGLILGSNHIEMRMEWIRRPVLREMLATTLAAEAAVLPILLYQSGNLSLVAIPANILAMPVLPAAMALSAVAAVIAFVFGPFIPILPIIFGIPPYILLWYVITIAEISARIPFANVILPAFPVWLVPAVYAVLGWFVWRAQKKAEGTPRPSHVISPFT